MLSKPACYVLGLGTASLFWAARDLIACLLAGEKPFG